MKNIKKLIIASVLSMITASCYAGSIVVGSEQQSSVDIGFASPQQLSVTFAPVAGLKAGVIKSNTRILRLLQLVLLLLNNSRSQRILRQRMS